MTFFAFKNVDTFCHLKRPIQSKLIYELVTYTLPFHKLQVCIKKQLNLPNQMANSFTDQIAKRFHICKLIFCHFCHNRRNGFCESEAGWQAEAVFWPQMRSQICQENPQVYLLHCYSNGDSLLGFLLKKFRESLWSPPRYVIENWIIVLNLLVCSAEQLQNSGSIFNFQRNQKVTPLIPFSLFSVYDLFRLDRPFLMQKSTHIAAYRFVKIQGLTYEICISECYIWVWEENLHWKVWPTLAEGLSVTSVVEFGGRESTGALF